MNCGGTSALPSPTDRPLQRALGGLLLAGSLLLGIHTMGADRVEGMASGSLSYCFWYADRCSPEELRSEILTVSQSQEGRVQELAIGSWTLQPVDWPPADPLPEGSFVEVEGRFVAPDRLMVERVLPHPWWRAKLLVGWVVTALWGCWLVLAAFRLWMRRRG